TVPGLQAAELRGTAAPPMEDASGGATGLPQIAQAGGGPARSAATRLDGLSVSGAPVPSAGRRRRSRDGATDDQRVATAPVPCLWTHCVPFSGRAGRLCHAVDVSATAHPAATPLPHAGPDPRPATASTTVRLASPRDALLHGRQGCGKSV